MTSALSFVAYVPQLETRFHTFSSTGIHAAMLEDVQRSLPFQHALRTLVQPGMRVLDVGAGTGILSLWALQAGAAHVDAIDNSEVGGTLTTAFRDNGFADRATAHIAYSTQVTLPERADLVVSETLGHIGIDEGTLATCADARARLAKADATFIPHALDVVAWPVWCPDFETSFSEFWHAKPFGFELSAMAPLGRRMTYLTHANTGQRIGDNGVMARHILGDAAGDEWHGATECTALFPSKCNGFFMSFVADLAPGVQCHGEATTSWRVLFVPAPRVFDVKRGDVLELEMTIPKQGSVRYSIQTAEADTMHVTTC